MIQMRGEVHSAFRDEPVPLAHVIRPSPRSRCRLRPAGRSGAAGGGRPGSSSGPRIRQHECVGGLRTSGRFRRVSSETSREGDLPIGSHLRRRWCSRPRGRLSGLCGLPRRCGLRLPGRGLPRLCRLPRLGWNRRRGILSLRRQGADTERRCECDRCCCEREPHIRSPCDRASDSIPLVSSRGCKGHTRTNRGFSLTWLVALANHYHLRAGEHRGVELWVNGGRGLAGWCRARRPARGSRIVAVHVRRMRRDNR
jgi:hypothetical protein